MSEVEDKSTRYLVPANVASKFEFFEGFGWKELISVVIALVIGAMLFFMMGLIRKTEQIHPDELSYEEKIGVDIEAITNKNGLIEREITVTPMIVRVLLFLIPPVVAFFFVRRDPNSGMSMMLLLKGAKKFKSKQKRYYYVYNSGSWKE